MKIEFRDDIVDNVPRANIISDRLARFKSTFPNFNYKIKLIITKTNSILKIKTWV